MNIKLLMKNQKSRGQVILYTEVKGHEIESWWGV